MVTIDRKKSFKSEVNAAGSTPKLYFGSVAKEDTLFLSPFFGHTNNTLFDDDGREIEICYFSKHTFAAFLRSQLSPRMPLSSSLNLKEREKKVATAIVRSWKGHVPLSDAAVDYEVYGGVDHEE